MSKWKRDAAKEGEAKKGEASISKVNEGEVELTKEIMKEFQSRIDKDKGKDKKSMTVVAEKYIQSTNTNFEMNGRMDFVVLEDRKSVV